MVAAFLAPKKGAGSDALSRGTHPGFHGALLVTQRNHRRVWPGGLLRRECLPGCVRLPTCRRSGGPILAINWDMWRDVGMTVRTSVPRCSGEWREQQLQLAMLPAEGVEVFSRALSQLPAPQIMVCTTNTRPRFEQFRSLTRSHILGAVEQLPLPEAPDAGVQHPRPNLRTPYLAPASETERAIAAIWQRVLGIERIGVQDG